MNETKLNMKKTVAEALTPLNSARTRAMRTLGWAAGADVFEAAPADERRDARTLLHRLFAAENALFDWLERQAPGCVSQISGGRSVTDHVAFAAGLIDGVSGAAAWEEFKTNNTGLENRYLPAWHATFPPAAGSPDAY
jgi:hypothetical protein